jgi:hypothetical protein
MRSREQAERVAIVEAACFFSAWHASVHADAFLTDLLRTRTVAEMGDMTIADFKRLARQFFADRAREHFDETLSCN